MAFMKVEVTPIEFKELLRQRKEQGKNYTIEKVDLRGFTAVWRHAVEVLAIIKIEDYKSFNGMRYDTYYACIDAKGNKFYHYAITDLFDPNDWTEEDERLDKELEMELQGV